MLLVFTSSRLVIAQSRSGFNMSFEGETQLGNEIDLFARYSINEKRQFVSVFSCFLIKEALTPDSLNPENAFYLALQALYTFDLKIM